MVTSVESADSVDVAVGVVDAGASDEVRAASDVADTVVVNDDGAA
ncbi:hypothetical protein GCM10023197_30540 [Gordonia humi]